jgi:hypothetical protein
MATTANYNITKPDVGGSTNQWGTIVNEALDDIDSTMKTIEDTAEAALPLAGGTMTGRITAKTSTMTRVDKGSISGATQFDLDAGNYFTATLGGNATFAFANLPAGAVATGWIIKIVNPGAHVITWPSSVKWPGGTVPSFTVSGTDTLLFITDDAGTIIRASILQKDCR